MKKNPLLHNIRAGLFLLGIGIFSPCLCAQETGKSPTPLPEAPAKPANPAPATTNPQNVQSTKVIKDKLDRIIIPELKLHEATVAEAIAYLRKKSIELDTTETDPVRKGVNIVLKLEGAPLPGASAISPADTKITLSLANIPLSVALNYVTRLAGLKYKIEPDAVKIVPLSGPADILITKEYKVPPGFLSMTGTLGGGSSPSPSPRAEGGSGVRAGGPGVAAVSSGTSFVPPTPFTALEYLKNGGVQFPPGAAASFLPQSSKLVVRNTQDNLDLVDEIVDAMAESTSQLNLETKAFVVSESEWKKLPKLYHAMLSSYFTDKPSETAHKGTNAVTPPQVSGTTEPGVPKSEAEVLKQLVKGPGGAMQLNTRAAFAGVITEGQRQEMAGALAKSGSEMASAPGFTIKSGKQEKIDITKKFAYPAGYHPGNKSPATLPEAPAIGEIVNVMVVVGPDGQTIDLDFGVVNATSLLGFLTEENGRTTLLPAPVKAVRGENYDKPVFSIATFGVEFSPHPIDTSAKDPDSVSIWDGGTVLIAASALEMQAGVNGGKPVVARKAVLIMITARLANGGNFIEEEEKEEDVVPLSLPDPPPLPSLPSPAR